MKPDKKNGIGREEMELLHYVAEKMPITVREVAEHLEVTKGYARSTVQTMMERLRLKGFLEREKRDGVYEYRTATPKPQLMGSLMGDFFERVLGGSLKPFVAYLAHDARLSDAELADLKRVVEQLDAQRKNEVTAKNEADSNTDDTSVA
ncbi:hypothetical protein IAD21_00806 [Abditibacteriota bacterium]|nr:hypothetical protein IAD21_00806 [Abditibacteriota bacterium]